MFTRLLACLAAALLSSAALGGDFTVTKVDATVVEVHYTGVVEEGDCAKWAEIEKVAAPRTVILTIDTPGGEAFEGLKLYWALEAYDGLVTLGGSEYGAWSAGAIMWLAGDYRWVEEGGTVAFHRAYCSWDPFPFPRIGCNPTPVDIAFAAIASDAGYNGPAFAFLLIIVQTDCGTDGWIRIDHEGRYWIEDTSEGTLVELDPKEILS